MDKPHVGSFLGRHWKALLALLGVSGLPDLLREFLRGKVMDWIVSHLGWFGEWLAGDPVGFLTLGVIAAILILAASLVREAFATHRESPILDKGGESSGTKGRIEKRWTISAVAILLIMASVVAWGWSKYQSKPRIHHLTLIMPPTGWITWWGAVPPDRIRVIVNVGPVVKYAPHFNLLLASRVEDNLVDSMEDTKIETSQLFSVVGPQMTMEMQMSQAFMSRAAPARMVYVTLLLVPKQVRPEQIRKLSDVARVNGNIMSTNGFVMPIERHLVPIPQ